MYAVIQGEVRGVKEKTDDQGKKTGKFYMLVEQATKGLPIPVYISSKKNSRKVGEKVSVNCFVSAGIDKNGKAVLWVNEVQ